MTKNEKTLLSIVNHLSLYGIPKTLAVKLLIGHGVDINLTMEDNSTMLLAAAGEGNASLVDFLLSFGADPDIPTASDYLAITNAAAKGHLAVIQALLRHRVDINSRARDGSTALYVAAENGQSDVVDYLLRCGADHSIAMNDGATPLIGAAWQGHLNAVQSLINNGAYIHHTMINGETALYMAASEGHCSVAQFLIDHGADTDGITNFATTPLYIAACEGHLPMVQLLISNGLDPSYRRWGVDVPLCGAAEKGQLDIVKYLISIGGDVNILDNTLNTPLHKAAEMGYSDITLYLLSSGADPTEKNYDLYTPLWCAANAGQTHIIDNDGKYRYLIEAKDHNKTIDDFIDAQVNVTSTRNAQTPVLCAAQNGNIKVIQYLVAHGASLHAESTNGSLGLHLAASANHYDVVEYFLDQGVNINATTKAGSSALYFATVNNDIPMIELLLSRGANVNIGDNGLFSPISAAMKTGNLAAIKLLLSRGANPNINPAGLSSWKKFLESTPIELLQLLIENGLDINCPAADGRTLLMQYVASNTSLDTIKAFLSMGNNVDINWQSPKSKRKGNEGVSALHLAVQNKSLELVKFMIECGANTNLQNETGATPLHLASWSDQNDIIQVLLENNADPMLQIKTMSYLNSCFPSLKQLDVRNMKFTAFHLACFQGHLETMQILTPLHDLGENQKNFFQVALDAACFPCREDIFNYILDLPQVEEMIKSGLFTDVLNHKLRQCVVQGREFAIESLLNHGADPNYAAPNKASVLCEACQFRKVDMAKILLKHHADPNASFYNGLSPLYWSINKYHTSMDIFYLLLEYGANPLALLDDGSNLIHAAARATATHLIPFFIDLGVDPYALNNENLNPLLVAITSSSEYSDSNDHVDYFIDNGLVLDINHQVVHGNTAYDGITALTLAARLNRPHLVSKFLQLGANPNLPYKNGLTALHIACWYGNPEMVMNLLVSGADQNMTCDSIDYLYDSNTNPAWISMEGTTAFHIACMQPDCYSYFQKNYEQVLELLLQRDSITINAKAGNEGLTGFMIACIRGDVNVINFLLKQPAIVKNEMDQNGNTAFLLACMHENVEVVKLLLCHNGINFTHRNKAGFGAVDLALTKENLDIVYTLMEDASIVVDVVQAILC